MQLRKKTYLQFEVRVVTHLRFAILCYFFIILFSSLLLSSCSKVSWAAFTTLKSDVNNVPKTLNLIGNPKIPYIQLFEYDKEYFMGLFVYKIGKVKRLNNLKEISTTQFFLPYNNKIKSVKNINIEKGNFGVWNWVKYIPEKNESQLITAHYVMEMINDLKKNSNVRFYSESRLDGRNNFILLYK